MLYILICGLELFEFVRRLLIHVKILEHPSPFMFSYIDRTHWFLLSTFLKCRTVYCNITISKNKEIDEKISNSKVVKFKINQGTPQRI